MQIQYDYYQPALTRSIRDDIMMRDLQISLYINNNKDDVKSRMLDIGENDIHFNSAFAESFIDAMCMCYADNVEKLNGYSFRITCKLENGMKGVSLTKAALGVMQYVLNLALECSIYKEYVAFDNMLLTTSENQESCLCVDVYVSPFKINIDDCSKGYRISKFSKLRLLLKEIYLILANKK